jgi:methylated-DNA-[protein]-cysteine S-methyltransferase
MMRLELQSPVGRLVLLASDAGLAGCLFADEPDLPRSPAGAAARRHLDGARAWLDAYFGGARLPALPTLDFETRRASPFARAVWRALTAIPLGETVSYGAIARAVGRPAASRAVGRANHANPIAILVPCHRVIGASGALTGYGGGLDRKAWLLAHERRLVAAQSGLHSN